ncbi:hypothetical protein JW879_10710 [candidate division WOR-3 bacterium]|nr:hypothetical protein [candidate division WOR-3 bacterium]
MKRILNWFLVIVIFFLIQCEKSENFTCPIVLGPRGVQMLISFESAKEICENRIEYVDIVKLEKGPVTARDFDGNVWEEIKPDSFIMVSEASKKVYMGPDGGQKFIMFKGSGENAYWLGLDEHYGKFYIMRDTSLQVAGFSEIKARVTPEGAGLVMTKGTEKDDYYAGSSFGKIYKAKDERDAEQIGVFDVFYIPVKDKPEIKRSIMMTKGMKEIDKWCGEQDGVIYIGK